MSTKGEMEFEVVEDEKQTAVVAAGKEFVGAEFVPLMIANLGDDATRSFLSFFVDHIRNRNTREAYLRAASRFFDWCDLRGLQFSDVQSFHVSAYIEELAQSLGACEYGVSVFLDKGSGRIGLGLCQVAACVSSLSGSLRIKSTPGSGTSVFVIIPASERR